MPSLDEASRCPKCSEAGKLMRTDPGRRGSKALTYNCMNERCRWFNTGWVVSVSSDGSIPERKAGDKEFPPMTELELAMGRRILEDAAERDLRNG